MAFKNELRNFIVLVLGCERTRRDRLQPEPHRQAPIAKDRAADAMFPCFQTTRRVNWSSSPRNRRPICLSDFRVIGPSQSVVVGRQTLLDPYGDVCPQLCGRRRTTAFFRILLCGGPCRFLMQLTGCMGDLGRTQVWKDRRRPGFEGRPLRFRFDIVRKRAPTGLRNFLDWAGYTTWVKAAFRRGLGDQTTPWTDSRPNVPRKLLSTETVDTRQTGDVRSTA
jgi:hypothetical protein